MRQYALRQTGLLLRRFSSQVNRIAESDHADAIHDLRVSIRRLSRCIRVFAGFYPRNVWKEIREELRGLLHLAGTVRDCDIAMECLEKAGVSSRAVVFRELRARRREAGQALLTEARLWRSQSVPRRWRERLEV
ncbi:MAG TPA: CHAD domain-containing protein [Candidatus Sulfopaludibacter sp.]|jgi:CHAD domain-containing protein|nr:CHAD domain-containing protein [Candidatus Sulfopaludibacter sp.]